MLKLRVVEINGRSTKWYSLKGSPDAEAVERLIEKLVDTELDENNDIEIQVKGNGRLPNINHPVMFVQG